jgi:hypothetical protein
MRNFFIFTFILILTGSLHSLPRHKQFIIADREIARADSAHGFDVQHYDITLDIDDQNHYIAGSVTALVTAEENLTEIGFELSSMNVVNVLVNNNPASFIYDDELINIQLGQISAGEDFNLQIEYSGNPTWNGLGMYFGNANVFTISDPNASRFWWPCYDHPWDKATVDLHITVRDDWLVASNGTRTAIIDNGNGTRTHHWSSEDPLATYLVSLTCQIYAEIWDNYLDIPIQNFVAPSQIANATEDFSNLPFMMEVFSNRFGDYPFEKYGNAVTAFATYAAMEHQTMSTLGNQIITGNHSGEMVIAHELAHQWFGNCLTPLTWADVWLSEGFATYSEAVYMQAWQGFDEMVNYLISSIQNYYKNWAGNTAYTIYDPPNPNMYFTPVTYEKAASVLHMIRLKTGDDMFWTVLQTYFDQYHNSNVITAEFQEVCQTVSGEDFEQFFFQWIYGSGLPSYDYTYFFNETLAVPRLMTFVQTSSNSETDFYLDIPVHINGAAGQDSVLVQAAPDSPLQTIAITAIPQYDEIVFDPNSWVLCRAKNFRGANINNAYAADGRIMVYWEEFWPEVNIDGYNLYRSESENGNYIQLNSNLITTTNFIDEDVVNGTTYFYKLKACRDNGYETPFSEVYSATPSSFPLDQGILVIDETRDGNGTQGNPDDQTVDSFYEDIINVEFTNWDYASQGAPPLDFLANFSTIIWHDDDLTQQLITDNIQNLGSYLAAGGNLIISGWKTADAIPSDFKIDFLQSPQTFLVSQWEFTSASSDIYPQLSIDPDKLIPAFGGTMPFVAIFPQAMNGIYNFEASGGSQFNGEVCALKNNPDGTFVLLGFPLFFFYQDQAAEFMQLILSEIGEVKLDQNVFSAVPVHLTNYPNPFNPSTTISFELTAKDAKDAKLEIFNIKGQKVKTLQVTPSQSSRTSVTWNGSDQNNLPVSSGIYLYQLKYGNFRITNKCMLMK